MSNATNDFLVECCGLIDSRKVDPFTNNPETKQTLNLLAYSVRAMLQEIKELEPTHWIKGPVKDHSSKYPGDVWVFKKVIEGYLIYIKLKIREVGGRKELFVMSFHPDRP